MILGLLLAVALVPAAFLVYLQYRSISGVRKLAHQALVDTLKQGLMGARVEVESDLRTWPRMALLGDNYHDWLQRADLDRIHHLAETTRRVCPHLSFFFAYQLNDRGRTPSVWIYRPAPVIRFMRRSEQDSAEPAIRELGTRIALNRSHFYNFYMDVDGERQQIFVHLADDELESGHGRAFGYYGFAIPVRTLAANYFPRVLREHFSRLAALLKVPERDVGGWIVDENGATVSSTHPDANGAFDVDEPLAAGTGVLPGWRFRARFARLNLDRIADPTLVKSLGPSLGIAGILLAAIVSIGFTASREMHLSRSKSELVASFSHELKTPIALIGGYAELLHSNRARTPEEREDYFRIIEAEVQRLSTMIDRILESCKIEGGIKSYSPEITDVSAIVEETLELFSYEAEKAGVAISRAHIEPNLIARVDAHGLSQAVLNLLSNAVKYSGKDGRVEISVRRCGRQAAIAVCDRGIGIPKKEQSRIFQRFYRARNAAAGCPDGAGLGLALVKHFAEGHNGSITVESEPRRGSKFTIMLPCETSRWNANEAAATKSSNESMDRTCNKQS